VNTTMLMGVGGSTMGPGLEKAPTGIPGLDQITGGGFPRGRVSLVAGSAGAGKTLLGLEFLVGGARKYGEPGILVSFEESAEKVALNVRSLGFDLEELEREGKLEVIAFQVDPTDMVAAGAFNLEPIFLILDDAIQRLGARRVVLDTMEMLYGAFGDDTTIRAELNRLARWLEERNVTAVVTGERGEKSVTRHGIEEYVTDCVILLDHRVTEEISTRRLRVLKYRGTVHGTNEFPFLISAQGFVVLPITSIVLDYPASDERMSTGVGRLDHMLGGGVFRGSTTLVTGVAGTGKTSLGAHMVDATCERGEQALWILFEESPAQVLRNMRSLGLDLQRWVDAGSLRIWAAQPSAFGLEAHLAALAQLMEDVTPSVVVLDGIGGLGLGVSGQEVGSMVARQIDLLKSSACTTMVTSRGREDESSTVSISSLVDTWLLLRNVETNGERNRLLFVLKSRGTAWSWSRCTSGRPGCWPARPGWPSRRSSVTRSCAGPTTWSSTCAACAAASASVRLTSSRPGTSSSPSRPRWTGSTVANAARSPTPRRTGRRWPASAGPTRLQTPTRLRVDAGPVWPRTMEENDDSTACGRREKRFSGRTW
jgi:circadian clock protein KaiC